MKKKWLVIVSGAVLAGFLISWTLRPASLQEILPHSQRNVNVILIVLDALRADHLSCYGYHRKTTPHLDALAAEGTMFEKAFAPCR
jgi:glucan phosphoethanolaminetransferase (alkaline phosphatase superfamily)